MSSPVLLTTKSAALSIPGRREVNEDAVREDPEHGLFVVADGTGGRAGGQVAAKLACDTVADALASVSDRSPLAIAKAIDSAVAAAHARIRERYSDPSLSGMATTLAVLLISGQAAHVAHVGDSRAYLVRKRRLTQLTRDHSLANYLADNPGTVPKVQRPGDTLMRALGLNAEAPAADHKDLDLQNGDVILVCSDGISSFVPDWALLALVAEASRIPEKDVAEGLTRAALNHGSMDNMSAILIRADDRAAAIRTLGWITFLEGERTGQVIAIEQLAEIGSAPTCQIAIAEKASAARHARIQATDLGFRIQDLGAEGGTFVNDVHVKEEALVDGDVIRVGATRMVFKCHRVS